MEQNNYELKVISPYINLESVKKLVQYCRDKVTTLPVMYIGDNQVYNTLKKELLRGVENENAINNVYILIDLEYKMCHLRLSIGVKSFDVEQSYLDWYR